MMFSGASNNHFTGGTFNVNVQGTTAGARSMYHSEGFQLLQQAVSPGAFHDAEDTVDPQKYHPDTRTTVIDEIMDWILGLNMDDQNALILWLYGPAGAGKSDIAHDIAHRCDLENLLLASFFFSHSDPTRSNAKSLIATIAYQIAINIPGTRGNIVATIERDPLIFSRSLEAQVASLIVKPLREPHEAGYFSTSTSRRLIIIDGLDECDTPAMQCNILQVISRMFHDYHLPLRVFVSSRPKGHLTRLFLTDNFRQVKDTLNLATRPRDWRQGYTPRDGIAALTANPLFIGRSRSDVQELADPVRRNLHPLILWDLQDPPIYFDLRHNSHSNLPKHIHFLNLNRPHKDIDFGQLVLQPSSALLRIWHPRLPWYIDVQQLHPNGVSVGDIFRQIHGHLHTQIQDKDSFNKELNETRVGGNSRLREAGVLRVDFLGDKCVFEGLVRSARGIWEMKTIRPQPLEGNL